MAAAELTRDGSQKGKIGHSSIFTGDFPIPNMTKARYFSIGIVCNLLVMYTITKCVQNNEAKQIIALLGL